MSDSLLKPAKGDEFFAPSVNEIEDKPESLMTIGKLIIKKTA